MGLNISMSTHFYREIIKKASWSAIATILYRGSLLASMMMVARIIGKEEFGIVGVIQSSITLFESVAIFGMSTTAAKYIAEYRAGARHKIHRIISLTRASSLIMGGSFAVALYYAAPFLAVEYLNKADLEPYLRFSAFIVGLNTFNSIQNGVLVGFEEFKSIAVINLYLGFFAIIFVVSGAYYLGVSGVLDGLLLVALVSTLGNMIYIRRVVCREGVLRKFSIFKEDFLIFVKFSVPSMLAGLLYAPVTWIGTSMLVHQPNGYSYMGVFNAANQWFSILLFVPTVVANTLLPNFSSKVGSQDIEGLKIAVSSATKLLIAVVLPFSIIIGIASPQIMRAYGAEYIDGAMVLIFIAASAAFASVQNMFGFALAAVNKIWLHTAANLIWASVYLLCAKILIEAHYEAVSLAMATAIAYFIKVAFSGFAIWLHLRAK